MNFITAPSALKHLCIETDKNLELEYTKALPNTPPPLPTLAEIYSGDFELSSKLSHSLIDV